MYRNVDEALSKAYFIFGATVVPKNNTAKIMDWCNRKGVSGGICELSQLERHADAAMIILAAEEILNNHELAAIELHYTGGMKADGIVDLTAYIERENKGVNLLICDAILAHIFGSLKQEAIQDKYDLSRKTVYNQKRKVEQIVNALLNSAWAKLDPEFRRRGIVKRERLSA